MPRACAFCAATATLSREHLWSNWLNDILPKSSFSFQRVDSINQKVRTWEREKLDEKARVVCKKCNETWMSDIESKEAKPSLGPLILDLSPRTIPIRALISIAVFLFKTSVIADHMGTGGEPFFSQAERYAFRDRLLVPSGVSMWIGALGDSFRGTFKTLHVAPVTLTDNEFGLYVFTYAVGHLVLQLVGAKWATHNTRRILPPEQSDSDSAHMLWFWPIAGNIKWPPAEYIPIGSLDKFTDRWRAPRAVPTR